MMRPTHVGDPELPYERQWELMTEILRTRGMIPLPNTYLVLDIETTGISPARSCILQIGWVQVIDGVIKSQGGVFVATPEDELRAYETGSYVQRKIAEGNEGYVKAADVRRCGAPRAQVFDTLRELYRAMMANFRGSVVIGHNLTGFDIPFIEYHAQKEGFPFKFDHTRVFDTGAAFKANKLGLLPRDDEPVWDFFCRVRDIRAKGVFWRLEIAVKELNVTDRVLADLQRMLDAMIKAGSARPETNVQELFHDASADTLATHHVYQELRSRKLAG